MIDERVRALAERVRGLAGEHGARVLVASASPGEGRSTLASELARCVARRGETVVIVDGSVRALGGVDAGLAEYLRGDLDDLARLVIPGDDCGVFRVTRGRAEVLPDLLASPRMRQLLEQLSERFDLVLVDGPPSELHADADVLARLCDGVLLVVKAESIPARSVRRVSQRIERAGAPVLGVALNQTDPLFVEERL